MWRRRRWRKWAKWMGVCACALILAAWGVSEFWQVGASWSTLLILAEDGQFTAFRLPSHFVTGDASWIFVPLEDNDRSFGFVRPCFDRYSDAVVLGVPSWCLLLLAGMPTALLFFLDRRKIRPGHCNQCGYDLRTMTAGRCPECGLAPAAKG